MELRHDLRRLAGMVQKPPRKNASSSVRRRSEDPKTVGDIRALGLRSVYITCSACGSASTVNVDHKHDDVFIASLGRDLRCAKCGNLGGVARPDWTELRGVAGDRKPYRRKGKAG